MANINKIVDGKVIQMTDEEQAEYDARQKAWTDGAAARRMRELRRQRDILLAETDFYAYKDYRTRIQDMIDKKIELILEDTWNNVTVDKNRYSEYVKNFE